MVENFNRVAKIIAYPVLFLSVFFMVIERFLMKIYTIFKAKLSTWKYRTFKDCILIPIEEEFFFDCKANVDEPDPEPPDFNEPTVYCQPFQEDEHLPEKVYNIKLSDFIKHF